MSEIRTPGATHPGVRRLPSSPKRELVQLTGTDLEVGVVHRKISELADPACPFVTTDHTVAIYGTGGYFLEYPSWEAFLTGGNVRRRPLTLHDAFGRAMHGEQANWDVLRHTWPEERSGGTIDVLYAGSMSPTSGRAATHWPDDNWTRRIYPFSWRDGMWRRHDEPLFGPVPDKLDWVGHCYGHHFMADAVGEVWVFYEKVTEGKTLADGECVPYRTELFARKMVTPFRADDHEIEILGLGENPYPATRRFHHRTGLPNGYLIEGARPVRVDVKGESFYVISFSSGDFPTDRYGINIAVSRALTGPYTPLLNETKSDLLDVGRELRAARQLSWGPGRASFFQDPWGEWWALFHAVEKRLLPDRRYDNWPDEPLHHFHRSLFLAPVEFIRGANGLPVPQFDL